MLSFSRRPLPPPPLLRVGLGLRLCSSYHRFPSSASLRIVRGRDSGSTYPGRILAPTLSCCLSGRFGGGVQVETHCLLSLDDETLPVLVSLGGHTTPYPYRLATFPRSFL